MFSLLYIDDEPGLLEIGQLFLERTGEFTVTTALSADAGLACLAQRDFDAVISDYQMPGMDGISLLKNVRKSYGNIPFVLFTGRGREEIVIEAINNGVDFYLQKGGDPKVQFAELAHKVRQAVNRRQAETALSDSEKRLADIINFLPDATFAIDMQGIVIAWNRAMEQMTGVSSAEILGKGNFEYAIPFYRERRPMLLNLVLSDNQNIAGKYPFVKREGKTLFSEITTYHFRGDTRATLWFTASPLYNWKGELTGSIESIRDITERKQAEEDLVSANREYTNLLDQIQDVYYRSDTEGRLVKASRSWATLFGYDDISECLGRSIADDFYVNPSDRKQLLDEIYRNGKVSGYEVLLKKKDGTPVLVEASSHLYFDPEGIVIGIEGTFRDITERKRADEKLRAAYSQITANEEKFRSIVETSPDIIWELDLQGKLRYVSPRIEAVMGYLPEEIIGRSIIDLVSEEVKPFILQELPCYASSTKPPLPLEVPARHRDGHELFLEIRPAPAGADGNVTGFRGVAVDITERKRAERALKTSEKRFRELAELLPQGIYEADANGTLTYANPRALEMFGHTEEDIKRGLNIRSTIAHKDRQRVETTFGQIAEQRIQPMVGTEYTALRKDGSTFPVSIFSSPVIRDGRIVGVRGIIIDITERKRAEEELLAVNEQLVASEEELRAQYDELAESEKRIRMSETRLTFMLGFYEYSQKGEKELLEYAIEGAGIVTGSPLGYLAFLNEDESQLSMYAWSNTAMAECSTQEKPIVYETKKTGLWGEAVRQRQPVITNDYAAPNPAKKGYPEGHPRIIRHMNVPVLDEGRVVLVAGVANKPSDYTEKDSSELLLLMQGLWTIIKRKRLQEEQKAAFEQISASEEELQQQYEQLKKNEEELRMLKISVDQSADEVFWLDFKGNILNVNDTACRINGYLREEFLQKTIFDLNPDLTPDIWAGSVADLKERKTQFITTRHKRKNGEIADVEIMAVYVNQSGREYSFAFVRDITERKKAQEKVLESEQNYRLLFETAAEGILIAQGDRMVKVNHAMVHLLGYSEEVITSQPFTDFVHPDDRTLVMSRHLQRMRGEIPPTGYEFRIITRDNQEKWVMINSTRIEWSGQPASLSFLIDITERKVAEERLVTANKEYTNLLDQIQDVYYHTDTEGRLVKASRSFATLLGYDDIGECLGRNIAEDFYVNAGDRNRLLEEIDRKGKVTDYEVHLRKKDGTPVLISTNSHISTDATGRILGIEGTFRDITERKRTETAIFESERKYRTLFETADEGIWTVDAEFSTTSANRKMQEMFGYTEQEMMGRPVWDFVPPEDAESVKQELFKRPKGIPGRYERRWLKKDGTIVWCFTSATPLFSADGSFAGSFGMFTDITERKQVEEDLFSSRQMLRQVLDTIPQRVFWKDVNSVYLGCNLPLAKDAGYANPAMLIGKDDYQTASKATADQYRSDDRQVMESGQPRLNFEEPQIKPDGSHAWLRTSKVPLRDKEGNIIGVLGTYEDITELRRAEESLRESEAKFRAVINQSFEFIGLMSTEGILIVANRSALEFAGKAESDVINRPFWETPWWAHSEELRERLKDAVLRAASGETVRFEATHPAADGHIATIDFSLKPVMGPTGKILYLIPEGRDITERKRAEEALRESEEKYRMLVESSFDGIAIHQDGILVYVNRTAGRLLGSDDPDVFIGRPAIGLVAPAFREGIMERIREAPEKPLNLIHEQFQRLDGTLIDVDVTSTPGTWKGKPAAFVTFRDITEQKRAEAALRESESRWRQWIEQSPIPIGLYRLDGTGIYSNVHFVRIIGYTLDEIPDMETYWRTMFPDPQYRQEIKMAWEDLVKGSIVHGGYIEPLKARILCRDGVTRTLEFTGLVIGDTILVTYYDLTTRKKAEEALHESEEKYRTLVEVNRDIIYSLDTDGTILYTSPQITAQLGYMPDEVEGHNFSEIVHPDDIGSLVRHIQENFITGKPVAQDQFRLRRKDGTYRWYKDKSIYTTDRRGRHIVSGTIRDITEEKAAQDALRESEEKFRTILDTTSEWIWDLDLHGCHTYSNPAVESLLGYTKDEILGINTFEMIHPDDRDRIKQIFASSVNKKSGWRNVRLRWQHKDGTYRFLESNATAIFNERGELTGFHGADRDITESVHAEDALRESEEKFRALVETTSDFIWEVDATGVYSYVSPQVCQILGYEPEEMIGRTPFDFMPPDEMERISSEFNRCITSRLPIVALENKAIRKDGSVVVLETSGVVRTANDGRYLGYRGIDRDITTRKEAAERTTRLSALKQDLLRTAPLEEKLKLITDGIVDIFGADFARIWMTGPGDLCDEGCIHAEVTKGPHICRNRNSCLHLIASSGRYTHTDGNHRRVPFGAYKIGRLATGEEAHFITNDVTHDPRVHDHAWAESLGLLSFSGFQLVSPDGEPIGVLAFFSREPITQDIVDDLDDMATTTSQVIQMGMAEEAQREREEWARTILNTAQTGIVLIDAETHLILDANPKALGMIGLPRDSVIGRICHTFICPAEKGNCPVTDGGQVVDTSERILVTASDTMVPVLKTVISVFLGGKKVLVESFVDISEQKRSEAAIQEVNRKLNLLSSITRHDVANQITVIQGYTQLAALSNPEPVIADFLAKIESGIDTIQSQIEFTRTYQDLGVQAPSWFVVGEVVRSVRHEGVKLVCTCKSYEIYADPMIGRVFFNLFDNAARYGERVTTIRVGCAKKGKTLVIRFTDNGVGIPPVEKKKIFQKGYGKHTGFGLFLAREILAITGITIQETGTYGKGAVFEITVPESSFRKAD